LTPFTLTPDPLALPWRALVPLAGGYGGPEEVPDALTKYDVTCSALCEGCENPMGFLDPAFSDSTLRITKPTPFILGEKRRGRKQKVKRLRDEKEGWPGLPGFRARARRLPTPSGKLAPGPSSAEKTDSEQCRAPTAGPGPGLSASLLSGTPAPCTNAGVSTTAGVSTSADVMGAGSSKLVGTDGGEAQAQETARHTTEEPKERGHRVPSQTRAQAQARAEAQLQPQAQPQRQAPGKAQAQASARGEARGRAQAEVLPRHTRKRPQGKGNNAREHSVH